MSPAEFKRIRNEMGLSQTELAEILGLSGRLPITHYETGVRNPSILIAALMRLLDQLSEKESRKLQEKLKELVSLEKKAKRKKP